MVIGLDILLTKLLQLFSPKKAESPDFLHRESSSPKTLIVREEAIVPSSKKGKPNLQELGES